MWRSFFFLALCLVWVVAGLFDHAPWKPDEAYSFGLVKHVLDSGDWVIPQLAGEPFMEKPPLFYITAAGFARLFSPLLPLHDGARLASGFYVLIVFLFAGLTGRKLSGKGYGEATVALLLGSPGLLYNTHLLITDTALCAGFAIATYGLALALERPRAGGIFLGVGTGVGFLSKGLLAPGAIGVTCLMLPAVFPRWRNNMYTRCLVTAILVALPFLVVWPLAVYHRSPRLFMDWLVLNNFGRFFAFSRLGMTNDRYSYLAVLPFFAFPALPLAAWSLRREKPAGFGRESVAIPLMLFAVTFGILEISSEGRDLYLLPLLIPLALLAAPAASSLTRRQAVGLFRFEAVLFTLLIGVLWAGWIALQTGYPAALAGVLYRFQPAFSPASRAAPFAIAALLTLCWLGSLAARSPEVDGGGAVGRWSSGMALSWGIAMALWLPWLDTGNSYRSVIASLARVLPPGHREIASEHLGEGQRAMLEYYAGITTNRLETMSHKPFDLLLVQCRSGEKDHVGPEWRKIWEGARPGDRKECFRLYDRGGGLGRQSRVEKRPGISRVSTVPSRRNPRS